MTRSERRAECAVHAICQIDLPGLTDHEMLAALGYLAGEIIRRNTHDAETDLACFISQLQHQVRQCLSH